MITPDLDILEARPVVVRTWRHLDLILVGCGGTGSWLAPHLARLAVVLRERGQSVTLTFIDPDLVETRNCARQNFCPAEVGLPKAVTLAWRYGTALGLDIVARVERFNAREWSAGTVRAYGLRVLVGCVDNAAGRQEMDAALTQAEAWSTPRDAPPTTWWLDCGNHAQAGQVLLGSSTLLRRLRTAFLAGGLCTALPSPAMQHPELLRAGPEDTPTANLSCAQLAQAHAQSLSINQTVAALATDYLVRLLITGDLIRWATYVDTQAGTMRSYYTSPDRVAQVLGQERAFFVADVPPVDDHAIEEEEDDDDIPNDAQPLDRA